MAKCRRQRCEREAELAPSANGQCIGHYKSSPEEEPVEVEEVEEDDEV